MTTKQVKNLAKVSYTRNVLDFKKVNRIVKLLNRNELKKYIRFLKSFEKGKTIKVLVSNLDAKNDLVKGLKKMYPNKRIEFLEDKSLIAGLRVIDNDVVYDFNLKNTFENLISYINQ